ncbi:hypothetical protein O181_067962 [Austropuccinia psidii MF-1]|uniref:Carboxylic ester hydrolase n=1 Tax=Austropuccinia psidii MF-1 TaxID=1389203 RepID=A0A9Q3EYF6_9BASI|nr:hypothetical protein [Austropuccinia psidii MF-1]
MSLSKPVPLGQLFEVSIPMDYSDPTSPFFEEKNRNRASVFPKRFVAFYVPNILRGRKNVNLLIAFHGSTENGPIFRARTTGYAYDQLACEYGFVVAYPSGYKGNWNDSRKAVTYPAKLEQIDDVGFTKAIIEYSAKRWSTFINRTFIIGYSNGGHLCYRLAFELGSSYIAGVAIHCANLPTDDNSDCTPLACDPIPICIVNGTADPVNPWRGGEVSFSPTSSSGNLVGSRGAHRSALDTSKYFAMRFFGAGYYLELEEIKDLDQIQDVLQFRNRSDGRILVKLIGMIGEGHYVPIAAGEKKALIIGPRRGAVHAPREVLRFFEESTTYFDDAKELISNHPIGEVTSQFLCAHFPAPS